MKKLIVIVLLFALFILHVSAANPQITAGTVKIEYLYTNNTYDFKAKARMLRGSSVSYKLNIKFITCMLKCDHIAVHLYYVYSQKMQTHSRANGGMETR